MKVVAVTQRVSIVPAYGERRDCLDQAWTRFLRTCGLLPLALPNDPDTAARLCEAGEVAGLVLTGGNDLVPLGGDAPERDATENTLLDLAECRNLPALGVCRGMQVIQHRFRIELRPVAGHVAPRQTIDIDGVPTEVNSYHRFGAVDSCPPLDVWARSADRTVKAVRHSSRLITGIMWHPERFVPFRTADIALFRQFFGVA